jgi:hypothetical protein
MPTADGQGARGGTDLTVAKQQPNGTDVNASFEQMGGKAVAQGRDAFALGDPSGALRLIIDFLGCANRHGWVGS